MVKTASRYRSSVNNGGELKPKSKLNVHKGRKYGLNAFWIYTISIDFNAGKPIKEVILFTPIPPFSKNHNERLPHNLVPWR